MKLLELWKPKNLPENRSIGKFKMENGQVKLFELCSGIPYCTLSDENVVCPEYISDDHIRVLKNCPSVDGTRRKMSMELYNNNNSEKLVKYKEV